MVGGSFEELAGCTLLDAVREFVGGLFGKIASR